MNNIQYDGQNIDSDNKKVSIKLDDTKKVIDYSTVKNAYQTLIIQKTLDAHEYITNFLNLTNPIYKITLAFILLNPHQSFSIGVKYSSILLSYGNFFKMSLCALIYKKPQPVKKTFEICYIVDNSINHLYIAIDWYLKSNSKIKKQDNYTILLMTKPIEASKKEKDYQVLKTVPEERETSFEFDNCTFSYSKTSFEDIVYAPSGEMKKRNHKLLIWSYDCDSEIFDNFSNTVMKLYASSKVDEVWTQKIHTHDSGLWKDSNLERNKRKISSVIMRDNKNLEISKLLNHFTQTEEWHLERGIPYKKSFLFYGPPGTGKSSMIKAMSFELQRHIHYLNLSVVKNDNELTNLMSKINYKETILVIEDIDAQTTVVHKRFKTVEEENNINNINENTYQTQNTDTTVLLSLLNNKNNHEKKEEPPKLTLSGILNQIDGIHNNHGMILVMTTNFPEKIDGALLRDGRVDERIYFDYCDYNQIYLMFKNFYNNIIDLEVIKSKIDLNVIKIAPCNVENSMRRYYNNPLEALDDIVKNINTKVVFEKFDV